MGGCFGQREAANHSEGAAPSDRAGPVRGERVAQLKELCSQAATPSLSARLFSFSLMVVQTLRMKIQESPVTCDTGRVVVGGGGGGDVRASDPDCEKTSCEDVPRLDLTALTEDNNWGGEAAH